MLFRSLTYQRISGPRLHHLGDPSGRGSARIQIACWAETYVSVKALAAAVQASLDGFNGNLSDGGSPSTLRSVVIHLDNEIDDYDPSPQTELYRVIADYRIHHEE